MKTLRTAVLGEFLEDIDILGLSWLVTQDEGQDKYGEKVGRVKLGEVDFAKSLGPSFFLFTVILVVLVLTLAIAYYFCRNRQFSSKVHTKVASVAKTIFYGALIRYSFLNYLKLNLSAMVCISGGDSVSLS